MGCPFLFASRQVFFMVVEEPMEKKINLCMCTEMGGDCIITIMLCFSLRNLQAGLALSLAYTSSIICKKQHKMMDYHLISNPE